MSQYRVPGRGRVDTSRPVNFTFDGRSYRGAQGDTHLVVAVARVANELHQSTHVHHRLAG